MPVTRALRRGRAEQGFTMLFALGVMLVVMLLSGAAFAAVMSDMGPGQTDLDGKRAYAAAEAGVQYYLGQISARASDSSWWQNCANDTATNVAVPGPTGATYSFAPVVAGCTTQGAINTVVDPGTGLLRMEFTGRAGTHGAQRTVVADFRTLSPLSYLSYTVHETQDPALAPGCPSGSQDYATDPSMSSNCWLLYGNDDSLHGPMYTQDQFFIYPGTTPHFGRPGDVVASPNPSSVCVVLGSNNQPQSASCPAGVLVGTAQTNAPLVPLPTDNSNLLTDAAQNNTELPPGTTTLQLNADGSASAETCSTSTESQCVSHVYPAAALTNGVLYAPSVNGASCPSYSPTSVTYQTYSDGVAYGACGNVYLQPATYGVSLTIAAANDIIVKGSVLNPTDTGGQTSPTGSTTLGLVANQNVRIYHPVTTTTSNGQTQCSGATPDLTIDAAILTLDHSFIVDNYNCGNVGTLTVHGSIAQQFNGVDATANGSGGVATGYKTSFAYDNRLRIVLPPYLFDLQDTAWNVVRETLCGSSLPSSSAQSCAFGTS